MRSFGFKSGGGGGSGGAGQAAEVSAIADLLAIATTSLTQGDLRYTQDTHTVWRWDGTAWRVYGAKYNIVATTSANLNTQFPPSTHNGLVAYANKRDYVSNGTNWIPTDGVFLDGAIFSDNYLHLKITNWATTGTVSLVVKKDGNSVAFTSYRGINANYTTNVGVTEIDLKISDSIAYDATKTYTVEYTSPGGVVTSFNPPHGIIGTSQTTTTSSTITIPTTAKLIDILLGGGGGGSFSGNALARWAHGGGGGEIAETFNIATTSTSTGTVVIGAGGIAQIGSDKWSAGSASSFTFNGETYVASGGRPNTTASGSISMAGQEYGNNVWTGNKVPYSGTLSIVTGQLYGAGGVGVMDQTATGIVTAYDTAGAPNSSSGAGAVHQSTPRVNEGGSGVFAYREKTW